MGGQFEIFGGCLSMTGKHTHDEMDWGFTFVSKSVSDPHAVVG